MQLQKKRRKRKTKNIDNFQLENLIKINPIQREQELPIEKEMRELFANFRSHNSSPVEYETQPVHVRRSSHLKEIEIEEPSFQ